MKFNQNDDEEFSEKDYCSWEEIDLLATIIADEVKRSNSKYEVILGVTNGGIIPARLIAQKLDVSHIQFIPVRDKILIPDEMPQLFSTKSYLVVDDIYDTGDIFTKIFPHLYHLNCDYAFLMKRFQDPIEGFQKIFIGKILNHKRWIVFPWE